jgi:lipopolysaccharide biosynthesis regulator YciM
MRKPPPSPPGVMRKQDLVELQMGNLRRELGAETDASIRAAILQHMGSLYEHELGRSSEANDYYARARNEAPSFQPAAIATIRIAERSADASQVEALCTARLAASRDSASRATTQLDLALRSSSWETLLREAVAGSPEPVVPALILEWLADAQSTPEALRDALRAQAEHTHEPSLRAALWLDVALDRIDAGEVDAALDALELASDSPEVEWAARSLQRRTARQHGRSEALVAASVSMAELLQSDAPMDPLSCSVPDDERLPLAAFLWQEAAVESAMKIGNADTAARHLASALKLFPEDRNLRLQALLLAELRGDDDEARHAARWFAETAPDDPAFVTHEIRHALRRSEQESSLALLRDAADRYPSSAYARAALDVALLRSEARAERVEQLLQRAEHAENESRSLLLWHAARLVAASARAPADAQALFVRAAEEGGRWRPAILRDALGAAIHARTPGAALVRAEDLLGCDITTDERSLLAFSRYDIARHLLRDERRADALLHEALRDESCAAWAPHVARVWAACSNDSAVLALAHEALALQSSAEQRVSHLCAASRAHARQGAWDASEKKLREALETAPNDRGVIAMLEAALREGGRPEDVVALARSRPESSSDAATAEKSLLLAGAAAEREGKLHAAQQAYEEALQHSPESPSAALALADVARRLGDVATQIRAYERLSEGDLSGGVPELFAMLRGDALAFANGSAPGAGPSYQRALDHSVTAVPSAVALLSMPRGLTTDEQRTAAEETLADSRVPGSRANGFGAAYAALRGALEEPGTSADDAWLQLASVAPTDALRACTLLHGLREMCIARGERAVDESFILAHESASLAGDQPHAAMAIDEALAPGDDPELRADALQHKLRYSTEVGRGSLDAAHCRALVEADRGGEAVALLTNAVDERPDDLALWETLRIAARQAGEWALVAQACERLARFVEGPLEADLLEEAGAVRLDCLQQYQQAEDSFRSALEADPTREIAFRRLHDLLADREDAEGLDKLVATRLALGGPKDRPDLLYERARLLRGFSDRPGALEVLDELFTTEPNHSGALALAAEVHVSLEQWEQAVECLRRLSQSGIPDEQRRLAHLGAADFLETRLGAKDEALVELRAVEALGLADAQTWLRIGSLEEGFENQGAAIDAYRRALEADPTQATAARRLADLVTGPDREPILRRYERAIWERIDAGELDLPLLEDLRNAALWRGDVERASAVAAVQAVLAPDAPSGPIPPDLARASTATVCHQNSDTLVEEVMRRAGTALHAARSRGEKLRENDPVYAELERLTERFGARFGSVSTADEARSVAANPGREGELHWVVPRSARAGLDPTQRFVAGRLAWAVPRGGGPLVEESPEKAGGTLAAILRASRCRVADGGPVLPAVAVKLRRAVRKSVEEIAGNSLLEPAALVAAARRLHRSADRAGLLACSDIAAALRSLSPGPTSIAALQTSARHLDLLRFWIAADSPLWGEDA